jgi:hypothetical protein
LSGNTLVNLETRQHISAPSFLSIVSAIADALTDRSDDLLLSRADAERLDSAAICFDSGKAIRLVMQAWPAGQQRRNSRPEGSCSGPWV